MSKRATLISITGTSGFNKSKIIKKIVNSDEKFDRIVSYTDRPKKENEVEGKDFHFVSEEKFTEMVDNEEFVEWQKIITTGFRYGKTKEDVEKALTDDPEKIIFTRVNIITLPVFKRHYPNSISIFIDIKDNLFLIDFLKKDSSSDEEYDQRYNYATEERRRRHLADHIINLKEDEEDTIAEILKIISKIG